MPRRIRRAGNDGGQLVRLDLDSIGESPLGVGVRVGYLVKESLAIEAEVNHFPKDPGNNFGHTQILAGPRYGFWFGPVGLFAKARPGRQDHFALDAGGVLLVGRGRVGVRLDAGDTMIFWGNRPFVTGLPLRVTRHNRQLSIGLAIHFLTGNTSPPSAILHVRPHASEDNYG